MSKRELLNSNEKEQIAAEYRAGNSCQEDLAIEYGVSRSTIRRALHEHGLVTNTRETTTNERSILETIKQFNIKTVEQLSSLIRKGLECK